MKHIGVIISYLRKSSNLTQQELAEKVGCTREFISQIERNLCNLPQYSMLSFSKHLNYDIEKIIKEIYKYNNFEHYLLSCKLVEYVEAMDIINIGILLTNKTIVNEFNYGYPYILKMYCTAIFERNINKDLQLSTEYCLDILKINHIVEIPNFTLTLGNEEHYYSTILVLGENLNDLQEYELHIDLLKNLINFLEKNIFNLALPMSSANYFYKKLYISTLNNYAHSLMLLNDFDLALEICENDIIFATSNNILLLLDLLYKLKTEILYKMSRIEEAKQAFNLYHSLCIITNKQINFKNTNYLFIEKYPLLYI